MRIGLVCPYSFDVPGGVQFHIRDLAQYLIRQGHEVSVLTPGEGDQQWPDYVVSTGRTVAVPYNGSIARVAMGPRTAAKVGRWLDEGNFDLIHIHEPICPSLSLLALRAAEVPVVATFHSSVERSRAMQAAYPLMRPSLEKILGRIAVSQDARTTVASHNGGEVAIVPNGVDTQFFAHAKRTTEWVGTQEAPTLAFLGRIEEARKGLPILTDAMTTVLQRFPGARLLVAGPGDTEAVASRLDPAVAAATTFLGRVDDEQKASLLASVNAYVAPQTGGESFGIVLIEAMAATAPVIASDLGAFVNVLGSPPAGEVFRNGDPQSLAKTIIGLLEDPPRQLQLRLLGPRRAREFDWDNVAEQIMKVYDTVLYAAGNTTVPRLRDRFFSGSKNS